MTGFPETFDEFVDLYGFIDVEEIYTCGLQMIPVFRVKQWLEHISEKTQMIDKSNFDIEQYKTELQSAYDLGYRQGYEKGKFIGHLKGFDKGFESASVDVNQ